MTATRSTTKRGAKPAGRSTGGKAIPLRTLQRIEVGLGALLVVAELHSPETPAGAAYVSAIRRRGEEAVEIGGGVPALEQLRRRLDETAQPERKTKRSEILTAAWSELEKEAAHG